MEENNKETTFFGDVLKPTQPLGMGNKANLDMQITGSRGWIAFIGILMIVYAALGLFLLFVLWAMVWAPGHSADSALGLYILFGLLFFGLMVFFGVLLLKSSSHAKRYLRQQDEKGLLGYHTKLHAFFKALGIVVIIGLLLVLILIFVSILT